MFLIWSKQYIFDAIKLTSNYLFSDWQTQNNANQTFELGRRANFLTFQIMGKYQKSYII